MDKDADVIANYKRPEYVLGGWVPQMAPLILSQPESLTASPGDSATFRVQVAAIPKASLQWNKYGKAIPGATAEILKIDHAGTASVGYYTVVASNSSGSVTSNRAVLALK